MFTMSVFVKPLIDLIPVWQCDRNWSKILCGTIPNPVHDLKVKVIDLGFLFIAAFVTDSFVLCVGTCFDMLHLWQHCSLCCHASSLAALLSVLTCFIFDNIALCVAMLHLWQYCSLCWDMLHLWQYCSLVSTCFIFDSIALCVDMLHLWQHCSLCCHASSLAILLSVLPCFIFGGIALCVDRLHLCQYCSLCWDMLHLWQQCSLCLHASSLTTLLSVLTMFYLWQHCSPVLMYFIFDNIAICVDHVLSLTALLSCFDVLHLWQHCYLCWHASSLTILLFVLM